LTSESRLDATTPHRCLTRGNLQYYGPVLALALYGVAWIVAHASEGSSIHSLLQVLALTEGVSALLLRRRKPAGALAGIIVAYVLFQLDPILLPVLLLALYTVAAQKRRRMLALAVAGSALAVYAVSLIGPRTAVQVDSYVLPRLVAIAVVAALGAFVGARKTPEERWP
jgi:hypothetical protein